MEERGGGDGGDGAGGGNLGPCIESDDTGATLCHSRLQTRIIPPSLEALELFPREVDSAVRYRMPYRVPYG